MKFLYFLSLFFAFFPYLSFFYTGTDIQPYSLVVNMFILFILVVTHKIKKIPKYSFLLFFPILLSIVMIFFSDNKFAGLRSLYGYHNLLISFLIYTYILIKNEKIFLKFFTSSIYIWTFVGFIQATYDRKFLIFLLPRKVESISFDIARGVTSLAPEPTFYGIVSLFFLLIISTIPKYKLKHYNLLLCMLLCSIIFIAKSSMVILFILLYLIIYILYNFFSIKKMIYFIAFVSIVFFIFNYIDFSSIKETRVYKLFTLAINNPLKIATIDASMNDRVSAIYYSMKGFFNSYGLPHIYGDYSNFLLIEVPKSSYFWYITINDRIKSFYGSMLFELGIIGLIYPIYISYLMKKNYSKNNFFIFFIFVNSILFTAIQLSFSFIPLYMASLYAYNRKRKV